MKKLLVDAPTGKQEVIEVGEGGGYFDESRVLWDERKDGELPPIILGAMKRENGELVADPAKLSELEAAELQQAKKALTASVNASRRAAIYTNVKVPFPADEKEIQFRDDQDRQNLSDKVVGAIALVVSGNGSQEVRFTCADNTIATMTAAEFIKAGQEVLVVKDALFYEYKKVKDMINAAQSTGDLEKAKQALGEIGE